jgi:hypothetical protein
MYSTEERQQTVPRAGRSLQRFVTGDISDRTKLVEQRRGRKSLVVEVISQWEQATLLGVQEKDAAHEHTNGGFIDLVRVDGRQQLALPFSIRSADRAHKQLDRLPDLLTELACYLRLSRGGFREQVLESVSVLGGKEPTSSEHRSERVEEYRLLGEQVGAERCSPHR